MGQLHGYAGGLEPFFRRREQDPALLAREPALGFVDAGQFLQQAAPAAQAHGDAELVARGDRVLALNDVQDLDCGPATAPGPGGILEPRGRVSGSRRERGREEPSMLYCVSLV